MLLGNFGWWGYLSAIAWTAWVATQIAGNLVVRIYLNDDGIWLSSGIFPWNKGIYGLNWRDISDAIYQTGFFELGIKVLHRDRTPSLHQGLGINVKQCGYTVMF